MNIITEEALCGPLCQHPSCWTSARRQSRNIPRRIEPLSTSTQGIDNRPSQASARSLPSNFDDYDLPKQSVVNLLDEYGEDPQDRFPSKFKGRPMHERSKSIMSALEIQQKSAHRTMTRESFSKGRAPQATPASFHREKKGAVGRVEVQEVFEFEELNRNWSDTFTAKQYYVWVPNPNKKKKPHPPQQKRSDRIHVKDVTEDLVPQEIEWMREATVQFDDVWPKLKQRQHGRSAYSESPYSRLQNYPLADQYTSIREPEPYYGIYELLDLPRDVLNHVLQHVTERDLLDRKKFTQALLEALPQLELQSREIALAKSEVLKQKPMDIYDGHLKAASRQASDFPTKPMFVMDSQDTEDYSIQQQHPPQLPVRTPSPSPSDKPVTGSDHTTSPRILNKHPTVPPIGKSVTKDDKARIPTISLGLPVIPSGVKHTKAFKYKGVEFDFALGPVPAVEHVEGPVAAASGTGDKGSNTTRSDKDSTIHVTVPSIPSSEEETQTEESQMYTTTTPHTQPVPPVNTPMQTYYDMESGSPSPTKSFPSPLRRQHQHPTAPVNTPQGPAITEFTSTDLAGPTLDPIKETDQDRKTTPRYEEIPPKSGKSVRFATDVTEDIPAVPPSSPSEKQEFDLSEATSIKTMEGSLSVNMPTTVAQDGRTVARSSKSRKSEDASAPPSRGYSKMSSAFSVSPEPWPQINEAEFNVSPTPPVKSAPVSRGTMRNEVQSMAVNYDSQSDISSAINRSALHSRDSKLPLSRESSDSRSMLKSRESLSGHRTSKSMPADSPAPPPPSPEPKEELPEGGVPKEGTGVSGASHLEDILETESEFTISARPPSNLDDESAINTPVISARVTRKSSLNKQQTPNQVALHILQKGKEKSEDSMKSHKQLPGGIVKEYTTTTIPSDSVTLADSEQQQRLQPSTDLSVTQKHDEISVPDSVDEQPSLFIPDDPAVPQNSKTNMHPDYEPPQTPNNESGLFVTGTKMGVKGNHGRGYNMSRPDETRKRPLVVPDNTPRDDGVEVNNQPMSVATAPPESDIVADDNNKLKDNNQTGSDINNEQETGNNNTNSETQLNGIEVGESGTDNNEPDGRKTELDTFEATEDEFRKELLLAYSRLSDNDDKDIDKYD